MLIFDTWKKIIILLVSLFAIIFSMPNFISKDNLPNFINAGEIRLGLDLQGGSYLLLKVDSDSLQTDRLNSVADELRIALRNANPRIGYTNLSVSGTNLQFSLIEENSKENTLYLCKQIFCHQHLSTANHVPNILHDHSKKDLHLLLL